MEAIARALGVLDGPEVEVELDRFLNILIERVMWSRRTSQLYEEDDQDNL